MAARLPCSPHRPLPMVTPNSSAPSMAHSFIRSSSRQKRLPWSPRDWRWGRPENRLPSTGVATFAAALALGLFIGVLINSWLGLELPLVAIALVVAVLLAAAIRMSVGSAAGLSARLPASPSAAGFANCRCWLRSCGRRSYRGGGFPCDDIGCGPGCTLKSVLAADCGSGGWIVDRSYCNALSGLKHRAAVLASRRVPFARKGVKSLRRTPDCSSTSNDRYFHVNYVKKGALTCRSHATMSSSTWHIS